MILTMKKYLFTILVSFFTLATQAQQLYVAHR